ncbi:hypothetical protein SEA_NIKE_78 [Microbacterium phage Nike]|nr:hypothetical protein SEA_NIKE_78 [Microbacterium phage Nike]
MVAMGNERDVDVAYIAEAKDIRGLENPGDEVIVQIDTGDRTKHLRVMLNEAVLFDGDPEVGTPIGVREQWGTMDVGVLGAPGFYVKSSRAEAEARCNNVGTEENPHFYRVPVKRTTMQIDGIAFSSPWQMFPTEEQLRLKPGWRASVGKESAHA